MSLEQTKLFEDVVPVKTYRAIRHDVVRKRQADNCPTAHHPDAKIDQVRRCIKGLAGWCDLSVLELFAGNGNLTRVYAEYGEVYANEYKGSVYENLKANTSDLYLVACNRVDSFKDFHSLIALGQTFDVIDLDPYGFPTRFFPDVCLLIENGLMFVTMPKPAVNILNGITQTHLISYFGEQNPTENAVIERIATFGLCHWRQVTLLDRLDLKSVWRFCFQVEKVKATDYTGVRNR